MAVRATKARGFEAIFPPDERHAARLLDEELKNQLAHDTYVSYTRHSKTLELVGANGATPVAVLFTAQNLKRLMALMAGKGHSHRAKVFYMYKRVSAFLAALGIIDQGEGDAIAAIRFKSRNRPKRVYLEDDGIAKVLDTIVHGGNYSPEERLLLAALFAILLLTGIRASELAGLELRDVDFSRGLINVRKAKLDRPRVVGIPRRLEPVLRLYLRHRPASAHPNFFINLAGTPMNRDLISKRFVRLSKLSGVHLTAHAMRRTMATQTARRNVPIDAIQAMLGHQSVLMTRAYIQTNVNAVASLMRDW